MGKKIDMNPGQQIGGQPQQPQVTLEMIKNSQYIECECGGKLFKEKLAFKKLSSILSPSGKEEFIPMPLMVCEKCGKVPSVFDPQGLAPEDFKIKKETK